MTMPLPRHAGSGLLPLAVGPDQAAEILHVSRSRIYDLIRQKEITTRRDRKRTLIEVSELQRWLRTLPVRGRRPDSEISEIAGEAAE